MWGERQRDPQKFSLPDALHVAMSLAISDPGTESSSSGEDTSLIPEKQVRSVHGNDWPAGQCIRRVVSQPARNSPPKRQKQADSGIPEEATIMSTILGVKSALESFNSRIYSLEQNSISAACNVNNAGPSSLTHASTSAFTHAVPLPADVTPLRTLGTAVPAPAMGSSFLPPAAAIPDSLRNHILAV
ncbi:hypothetical protein NQZ68_009017 [Dissostichus eleginoides]|nr:hypothetical protein NQZ68_009017 [Dissostichus eleginoides]